MSTYRLDKFFSPRSLVLVGASPRPESLGRNLLKNLREGGFSGTIQLVNPKYPEIDGIACVAGIVEALGARGVPAAIIVTAGMGYGPRTLSDEARLIARRTGLRLVGPNGL